MTRVKRGYIAKRRRNRIFNLTAGSCRAHSRLFRPANQQAIKSMANSHRDRGKRKRDFRRLWIARMNAASRTEGIPYNQLIHQLHGAHVILNRKTLAQIAVLDNNTFVNILNKTCQKT